jgi:hypothetical protein
MVVGRTGRSGPAVPRQRVRAKGPAVFPNRFGRSDRDVRSVRICCSCARGPPNGPPTLSDFARWRAEQLSDFWRWRAEQKLSASRRIAPNVSLGSVCAGIPRRQAQRPPSPSQRHAAPRSPRRRRYRLARAMWWLQRAAYAGASSQLSRRSARSPDWDGLVGASGRPGG